MPPTWSAAAMPVIMQNNKTTVTMLGVGVNRHFNYARYFSMVPVGPEGVKAFSKGFFELAAAQQPKPQTVAMLSPMRNLPGPRLTARGKTPNLGFKVVYDKSYPPPTTDFAPIVRAIQAANADMVFVAAYPPDTVGIVRAANEIGLTPKMFGGTMIGLLANADQGAARSAHSTASSSWKASCRRRPSNFPASTMCSAQISREAAGEKLDPFGYGFVPFGYAAGQILAKAVTADQEPRSKQARQIHPRPQFSTVAGEIAFGKDGEWAKPRTVFTQFQNVAPNDVEQFAAGANSRSCGRRNSRPAT